MQIITWLLVEDISSTVFSQEIMGILMYEDMSFLLGFKITDKLLDLVFPCHDRSHECQGLL